MKINIQIEDASPEDLQRLFAQTPGITFVPARPKIKEEFLAQPPPLPTTTTTVQIDPMVQSTPTPIITVTKIPEVKKEVKKTKKSSQRLHGDLQLPVKFSDDKKAYQAAWSLCRRFGFVPYPEALKLKEAEQAQRAAKPKKPCSPAHQRVHEAVKNAPPAVEIHKKLNDIVVKQNGPLHPGQLVKHNGPKASPFFGKVGEILKIADDGQLFVKFGSSTTWLPNYLVMAIPEVPA